MEKIINDAKNKVNYDMIVTIIGRGFSDYVVSAARDAGATGARKRTCFDFG